MSLFHHPDRNLWYGLKKDETDRVGGGTYLFVSFEGKGTIESLENVYQDQDQVHVQV